MSQLSFEHHGLSYHAQWSKRLRIDGRSLDAYIVWKERSGPLDAANDDFETIAIPGGIAKKRRAAMLIAAMSNRLQMAW